MAELGWCRIADATQWAQECAAAGKVLLQSVEPQTNGHPLASAELHPEPIAVDNSALVSKVNGHPNKQATDAETKRQAEAPARVGVRDFVGKCLNERRGAWLDGQVANFRVSALIEWLEQEETNHR
jgi:hypothetical protein